MSDSAPPYIVAPGSNAAPSASVGILAGGGRLPVMLAESIAARGGSVHFLAIEGEAEPEVARFPHTWVNLAQIGRMVATLRGARAGDLVIAGVVRRPDIWKLRPDAGFFISLPHVMGLMAGGDDSVLSRVVRFFEAKGFTVRGAHEVAPDLLAQSGPLGTHSLSAQARSDAALGFAVRAALGPLDAGQAVAVADGQVLAIEGAEGTDAMLERVAGLPGRTAGNPSGVLAKGPKPGQELRVDMPAIGLRTVELAARAGLAGIAAEADAVLVLGRDEAIRAADAIGFAVEGLPRTLAQHPAPAGQEECRIRPIGHRHASRRELMDVETGIAAVERLAPFGTGAAVVVSRDYILAIGAQETPAAMLQRVGALRQWGARGKRRIGVLVCRAEQASAAADVRAIPEEAARQGLAGIAVTGPAPLVAQYEELWLGVDPGKLVMMVCDAEGRS